MSRFLYWLYSRNIKQELQHAVLPQHIGMIIDGNRRWAKQVGLDSAADGYRAGAKKMIEFLTWSDELKIPMVTLYLLSQDNLKRRPSNELEGLVPIIAELATHIAEWDGWKVKHVGSTEGLPEVLANALQQAEQKTRENTGMHINLAVGYGGRGEIVDAVKKMLRKATTTNEDIEQLAEKLTPEVLAQHLYTGGLPDPDLVIRTSGEQRLSDFMLWQSAHSEFYFVEALGPDLREVDLLRALRDFAKRQRRFGG